MSVSHKIKFYPVDNGDNVLLKLDDNTTVIVDCQIRESEENSKGITVYDVKKDLIKELSKDSKSNPYVDLFINTHPHKDHCLGFGKNYYHGSPDDYTETNRKKDEIIIGELWVTQMFFSNDLCDDASDVRKEAKRRRKLFEDGSKDSSKYGNRLRIIGYNSEDKTVDGLHYIPGNTIETFNGKKNDYLSIFIHAPFKSDLVRGKAEKDKNATSIVVQMRLRTKKNGDIKSQIIIGGDADHYVWEHILDKSKNHNNEDKLNWDLFLAPHHCSWTFFNDTPYKDNKTPKDYALEFLDYKNQGSHIIASSAKIENNDNNPPCYQAKQEYVKKVGETKFKNTAINKDEKAPEPLVYTIGDNGFTLQKTAVAASATILSSSAPRAGRC
ncbi:MAG: hypothetical protein LBE13_06630 [Bacteroidales bacterium]|jgi:hypothetical protein|nr:hypothetical protein [Bacteroidales bacterium]